MKGKKQINKKERRNESDKCRKVEKETYRKTITKAMK